MFLDLILRWPHTKNIIYTYHDSVIEFLWPPYFQNSLQYEINIKFNIRLYPTSETCALISFSEMVTVSASIVEVVIVIERV